MRHIVVVNDLPLHYLDKPENKVFSKHEDAWVSSKTMRKYLKCMAVIVKEKIQGRLPDKFAVYFDGWTNRKNHYLGVVASFIDRGVPEQRLLSLSPILDIPPGASDNTPDDEFISVFSPENTNGNVASSFTAEIIKSNLTHVLRTYYNKRWKNVTNLGGDNASVCHRVAELARKSYDPCCNHLLSLELHRVVKFEQPLEDALSAVHDVMKEASRLKVAPEVKKLTNLTALLPGQTRWSANITMLRRFFQLHEAKAIEKIPELRRVASYDRMKDKLELTREVFGIQQMFCLDLQRDACGDASKANMSACWDILCNARTALEEDCRKARPGVAGMLPYECRYIKLNSEICNKPVGNVHFLSGVYKIQKGKELDLSDEEKDAVAIFLIAQVAEAGEDSDDDEYTNGQADAPVVSPERKRQKAILERKARIESANGTAVMTAPSDYIDTRFVVGTNNTCERTFSRARRILTDFRASMGQWMLELLLFLKLNEDLWDASDIPAMLSMHRRKIVETPGCGRDDDDDVDSDDEERDNDGESESISSGSIGGERNVGESTNNTNDIEEID
jgi:hypothetical protein